MHRVPMQSGDADHASQRRLEYLKAAVLVPRHGDVFLRRMFTVVDYLTRKMELKRIGAFSNA